MSETGNEMASVTAGDVTVIITTFTCACSLKIRAHVNVVIYVVTSPAVTRSLQNSVMEMRKSLGYPDLVEIPYDIDDNK